MLKYEKETDEETGCVHWNVLNDLGHVIANGMSEEIARDIVVAVNERWEMEVERRDLATLVRQLCRNCTSAPIVAKALDYLRRKNLQGSPLRT